MDGWEGGLWFEFVHVEFACVRRKMLRAAEEEVWNYKRSEADADVLFMHAAQTNSLSFSMLHSTHFIFLEHISGKSVLGNGEPGFCLPGTRWGLCDHSGSLKSPPASPPLPPTTPLLIETVKVKTLASAYFPESKHQMLRFGSRMMTVCPKNLPHYVISVSIMCKLWKTCILCVMWLLSIFF